MRVWIAVGPSETFDIHFPQAMLDRLCAFARVGIQQTPGRISTEQLSAEMGDADVLMTHWGTPPITEALLDAHPNLKVVAHCAGSVANLCTEAVFERGLTVLSANPIMSEYVAEAILGYLILGLRQVTRYNDGVKQGGWPVLHDDTLIGAPVGFVGLGMVGRHLLHMLAPLRPQVRVYDPYVQPEALAPWPFARLTSLEEAVEGARAITLQAAKTPETVHLVSRDVLAALPDGALVVNAARGSVLDTGALVEELSKGRLRAVLDVYDQEPLALDDPLRSLPAATLIPHRAGAPGRWRMTQAILEDLARIDQGEAPQLTVSRRQFSLMTRE